MVDHNPLQRKKLFLFDLDGTLYLGDRLFEGVRELLSCIFQGIIPYGAQMLVAISAAHELGYAISAFDIIPNLFYPYLLAVSSFFFIAIDSKKKA